MDATTPFRLRLLLRRRAERELTIRRVRHRFFAAAYRWQQRMLLLRGLST